ncbi:unnamed protein product [Cladocopium goreaui]|uniref:Polyketide synthase dehydratase domain-containing protein n=1 Tax=Cladocopium goreaui TaxID=2562237 RepID=A0A9P1DC28_9DINO|nr:unnamed protein product [Cladocopium goreaui]
MSMLLDCTYVLAVTVDTMFARRQYVPPVLDTAQDFILAMKCRSAKDRERKKNVEACLMRELAFIADSFSPQPHPNLNLDLVQAKLDALLFDDEAFHWIYDRFKLVPVGHFNIHMYCTVFVKGVVKKLYNEHVLNSSECVNEMELKTDAVCSSGTSDADMEPVHVILKALAHPGEGLPRTQIQCVLNSGIPEGTAATTSLPDDAWDLLGLGVTDGLNDRELHIKNGQVCLLTGGDYMSAKRRYALENREAHRAQWRQQAEQRLAKAESRRGGVEKAAAESGVMKTQKFTWSKDGAKSFEWRKIYHALVGQVGPGEGGLLAEALITPTSMRMYTDHRVMGQVVLPGVSHVSLMAATASLGFPSPGGGMGDWHISVKEVLFERPYIVHSGADLIAAIANGVDPSTVQAMAGGLPIPMTPVGVPTTYCRSTTVTKERGIIKSTMDWAK